DSQTRALLLHHHPRCMHCRSGVARFFVSKFYLPATSALATLPCRVLVLAVPAILIVVSGTAASKKRSLSASPMIEINCRRTLHWPYPADCSRDADANSKTSS